MLASSPATSITEVEGKPLPSESRDENGPGVPGPGRRPAAVRRQAGHGDGGGRRRQGRTPRTVQVQPHFRTPFNGRQLNFGGMVPRVRVMQVSKESQSFGKLLPGDVITAHQHQRRRRQRRRRQPQPQGLPPAMNDAGKAEVRRQRDGAARRQGGARSTAWARPKIDRENSGLKIGAGLRRGAPGRRRRASRTAPPRRRRSRAGATILQVAGQPVSTWYDVQTGLQQVAGPRTRPRGTPLPPVPLDLPDRGRRGEEGRPGAEPGEADGDPLATATARTWTWTRATTSARPSNPLVAAGGACRDARLHPPVLPDPPPDGDAAASRPRT